MNFFKKKYEKIIEISEPHISEKNIPEPSENLFVFRDAEDLILISNDSEKNILEYSQFDEMGMLVELFTMKKEYISNFSIIIQDDKKKLYEVCIQGDDGNSLFVSKLPYEEACDLYKFVQKHSLNTKQINNKNTQLTFPKIPTEKPKSEICDYKAKNLDFGKNSDKERQFLREAQLIPM